MLGWTDRPPVLLEQTGGGTGARREQPSQDGDALGGGRSLPSVVEELLALEVDASPQEADGVEERVRRYRNGFATSGLPHELVPRRRTCGNPRVG